MKPILFESNVTSFANKNGLGRIDAISCTVTEERNGQYELEMEVSIDDEHYGDIQEGRILYCRHDETTDMQPFDIYYISRPLNGVVSVLAHHVSYRSMTTVIDPFTATSIADVFSKLANKMIGNYSVLSPFTFWTDKTTVGAYKTIIPKTLRSILGGEEGSVLDVYGTGEYEWDKFTVKLHAQRGTNTGITIRYGKDLLDVNKVTDMSSLWTGIVPYWQGTTIGDDDEPYVVMLTEKYINASSALGLPYRMYLPVDLSDKFDGMPSESELRTAANAYVSENFKNSIPTSIDVSFVNLASYDEFKDVAPLQRLKLCDTVTVKYDKLGVANTAKIVKTVFNVLTEKYDSMTLGEIGKDLTTTMTSGIKQEIQSLDNKIHRSTNEMTSMMQGMIDEQTELIRGGAGGYIVMPADANGKPQEILAMNTDNVNTATNVLRINYNGIGFSSQGINGPYNSAWTLDGKFNADFIQTGTLNANIIKAGVISDAQGNNSWDLSTGTLTMASGSINIGNGIFEVDSNGNLTAQSAVLNGSLYSSDINTWFKIENGKITGGPIGTQTCSIKFDSHGGNPGLELSSNNLYFKGDIYVHSGSSWDHGVSRTFSFADYYGQMQFIYFENGICIGHSS